MKVIEITDEQDTLQPWTVRDLMAELAKVKPDLLVVLAKDAEGNDHHPLMCVAPDARYREGRWEREVLDPDNDPITAADRPCVVLWPMD